MIFSENKLRQMANIPNSITTEQIVNAINSIGFEVESVSQFNKNKGLKFGYVLSTKKNPNSKKLNICEIKFDDQTRIIQTAAQNVKEGDYLIAFVPGSKMNDVIMKEKELAGITSYGMLVSFEELGFDVNLLREKWKEDILILDEVVDLSLDPIKYFDLEDNLIDVSILSNRSDAQSYLVFAKELAAYFKTNYNFSFIESKNLFNSKLTLPNEYKLNGSIVEINNKFKLTLKDIMFILKSKIKSINDFEDFSSFVMLYTGVYPRSIDYDLIDNSLLKITNKNKLVVLENENNEDISILGIDINTNFKPTISSKRVFFEFSQIDPKIIRENSRNLKISNNSSINSSKVISDGSILYTYKFLQNYFPNISNLINPLNENEKEIIFDKEYLIKYAGEDITKNINYKNAIKSLEILGFKFSNKVIKVPIYRHDVNTMQDIVEEIFRFYGLNNFLPDQPKQKITHVQTYSNLEQKISFLGYTQAWTYTLINKELNNFNPFNFKNILELKTFVSEEYNSIRNSIALPLLNVYEYNIKRKMENLSLFDIGMINDKKSLIISSNTKTYTEIKTDLEKITNQKFFVQKLEDDKLHPNYNAALFVSGQQVGWIGKLNPFWKDSNVIFGEVLLDCIYKNPYNHFIDYDNEPLKERDITISVNKNSSPIYILEKIKMIGDFFSIDLLSIYEKEDIVNWTYKIKMPNSILDIFDRKIKEIKEVI